MSLPVWVERESKDSQTLRRGYVANAIINGKRHDREIADPVASPSAPGNSSDFFWYEETLYRTAKGTWFTAGHGGPMTSYA